MKQAKKESYSNPVLSRIVKNNDLDATIAHLMKIKGAELKSILLHVFNERANLQSANKLLALYQKDYAFLGASELSQKEIVRFQNTFFECLPKEFQVVELSPLSPLGTNRILAKINQNNLCSTNRGYENVGDPTTSLAIETALRRKKLLSTDKKSPQKIHLCTSQRILRFQPFDSKKGYMQHFRCIGLSSGGRDSKLEFAIQNLLLHLKAHLGFIQALNAKSFSIKNITVSFSHLGILESILNKAELDRETIRRSTGHSNYRLFKNHRIQLPPKVEKIEDISAKDASDFSISEFIDYLAKVTVPIINNLQIDFPEVKFVFNLERIAGMGYYDDLCFHIHGTNTDGMVVQISDGGFTDWLKKLLASEKELLLVSGLGEDLVHKMFRMLNKT